MVHVASRLNAALRHVGAVDEVRSEVVPVNRLRRDSHDKVTVSKRQLSVWVGSAARPGQTSKYDQLQKLGT